MKSYTFLFLFVFLLFSSCKKESLKDCTTPIEAVSLVDAVVLKEGSFVFTTSKSQGIAKIYQQKNGRYVVGLEEMNVVADADMEVYLSKTSVLSATSVKLFSTPSIYGNKYYLLPSNFSIDGFGYILLTDDRHETAIGTAAAGLN